MKQTFAIVMSTVLGILLLATPALAHDADGKWTGSIETPMGTVPVGFTLKADGTALTGTSLGPDGGEIAIKNGKVDGDKISFVENAMYMDMPLRFEYTGTLTNDELRLSRKLMDFEAETIVAKRAK